MSRYFALIDGEEGNYGVAFPDLKGCAAAGDTVDEALDNAIASLADWAIDMVAAGKMPEPSTADEIRRDQDVQKALARGAILTSLPLVMETGRTIRANISVDEGVLKLIDETAQKRGVTRSAFLVTAAREKIIEEV